MAATGTASFATLPDELRVSIIATACQDDYDFAGVSGKKALNLMLTSRDTYAITAPLLYKNIKITKPSVLADFERALASRPTLGHLVKSLYLGPDRHLPHDWWPIKNCEPEAAAFGWQEITTSLKDQTQLPRGCAPLASWRLKGSEKDRTPCSAAVIDAVEAAQASLNVALSTPCRDFGGKEVGSAEYVIRVMQVQAALDLYLIEMRRTEDERHNAAEEASTSKQKPSASEPDNPYPRLVFVAEPALSSKGSDGLDIGSSNSGAGDTFEVDRTKLVKHLARRGGSADYFDHPHITARSNLQTFTFVDDWQPSLGSLALQLSALHDNIVSNTPLHPVHVRYGAGPSDQDCPSTASVRGLLTLGRSVVCMLPRLENLFLNSFLQQLACGQSAHELPPTVCTVSLGPLSPWHPDSLAPACVEGRLDYLEQLFLCGTEYAKEKVAAIAATPILQQADWDLKNNNVEWDGVFSAFRRLLRISSLAGSTEAPSVKKRSRSSFEHDSDDSIRLDPGHYEALPEVLSAKTWASFKTSRLVPGTPYPVSFRGVHDSYFDEERWDEAGYEMELAYGDIKDRWEHCVTGRWPWEHY